MRTLLAAMLAMLCTSPVFAASNETLAQIRGISATVNVADVFDGDLVSSGSGTISFANNKLWCLTAYHVIEDADSLMTISVVNCRCNADGAQASISFDATVEESSAKLDIALLQLRPQSAKVYAEFKGEFAFGLLKAWPVDGKQIAIDSRLISVGTYQGEGHQSLTEGKLRWIGRHVETGAFDQAEFTVYHGSSGGGVFSDDGKFVGMTVRAIVPCVAFYVPSRVIIPWLVKIGHGDIVDAAPLAKPVKVKACSCGCDCGPDCQCGCHDELKCHCDVSNWLADGLWDAVAAAIVTTPNFDVATLPKKLPRAMERGVERFAMQAELWNSYCSWPWRWHDPFSNTETNIRWTRQQWVDMDKYPKLREALRFPPFDVVQKYRDDAYKDVDMINEYIVLTPYWRRNQIEPWLPVVERNLHGWNVMMNAVNHDASFSVRRQALDELRDMMGADYFQSYQWFGE